MAQTCKGELAEGHKEGAPMRNLLNFILRFVAPMALALGALTTTPTRGAAADAYGVGGGWIG